MASGFGFADHVIMIIIIHNNGGLLDGCRVPTLEGEADVRVRPGTQPGDRLRMRGYGIPHVHNPSRKVGAALVDPNADLPATVWTALEHNAVSTHIVLHVLKQVKN